MTTSITVDSYFNKIARSIDEAETAIHYGTVVKISGFMIEAIGLSAPVGACCELLIASQQRIFLAEVIGFSNNQTFLMAYEEINGVLPGNKIRLIHQHMQIAASDALLGRVVNGLCQPIDDKGAIEEHPWYPIYVSPINPIKRARIDSPLDVGVRAINALMTVGRGQRLGIFAGSGVGKSVLLGMMTRFTEADVVVVGLIGERGREVKEFIEENIGASYLKKTVIIAAPVDTSPLMRTNGALVATSIAEYFRDKGLHVLLIIDSLTRYAQALRQLYLTLGEMPSSKGFSPSVFSKISQLVERSGTGTVTQGTITAFYTVLTEGDDINDPVADHARSILDGHFMLSRRLAESGHYPAIDISRSISRVMPSITSAAHQQAALTFKRLFSAYESNHELIKMGMYQFGSDKVVDDAMQHHDTLMQYLQQGMAEHIGYQDAVTALLGLFK